METFAELMEQVLKIFPGAEVHEDYRTGELTVSTGLREVPGGKVVPLDSPTTD